MTLQYDGTAYNGWQVQSSGTTIQGLLQDSLFRLTGESVSVVGAGRTDAGVHALEQVASFASGSLLETGIMRRALNAMLPSDIRVMDIAETDGDFHPRYAARAKRYIYVIANTQDVPVFLSRYLWQVRFPLDVEAMQTASFCVIGRHDFSSFRGSGCSAKTTVRTIHRLGVEKTGEMPFLFTAFRGDFIKISIEGDGFLRHMVRNLVGTLVEVGRGRTRALDMRGILEAKDRRRAGPAAPPGGLFLDKVIY